MDIRLVAMDLDGTLLGTDKRISSENLRALHACESRGVSMVLASGRSYESVAQLAQEAGLHSPVISSNGARVDWSPDGPMASETFFPLELSRSVYDLLMDCGLHFALYGPGCIFQRNPQAKAINEPLASLTAVEACQLGPGGIEITCDLARMREEGVPRAYKYVVFSERPEVLATLRSQLDRIGCRVRSSWPDNLEILWPGVGKDCAVLFLADQMGLSRDQIMCFGDQLNDLDMLRAAGHPVAMLNGAEEVKNEAEIIAPHHDQSGVATVLKRYVLGEE